MLQAFISDLFSYRNRIGLLLGENSVFLMRAYINGACKIFFLNGEMESCLVLGRYWQWYVEEHYGLEPDHGVEGWPRLIKAHTTSEEEAIQVFFNLLEQYIRDKCPDIKLEP